MDSTYKEGTPTSGGSDRRCPPRSVYLRLLAGGTATLQLSPRHGAVVLGGGLLASLVGLGWSAEELGWFTFAVTAWTVGNVLTGLVLAALSARWLGSRIGVVAGLAHVTYLETLMPDRHSSTSSLASLAASVAIGAFALAQVPGRLPPDDRRTGFGSFCVATAGAVFLGGLGGPACILAVCLGYLALFQDGSGLRFFVARLRPAILALSLAAVLLTTALMGLFGASDPHGLWDSAASAPPVAAPDQPGVVDGLLWAGIRLLPWWPWALWAIIAGLRQGHYAAPFGRLLIAWLLVPWMLWAAGVLPARTPFAFSAPAVAVTAAIGASNGVRRFQAVMRL